MGHALLNAEAITAVSFVLLLLWRVRPVTSAAKGIPVCNAVLCGGVTIFSALLFWPSLNNPLLHDSYGLVYLPSQQTFAGVLRLFYVNPKSGDSFYRPLSYLIYWLYSKWAHFEPFRWHLLSVAVHLINTVLVYTLARQLGLPKLASSGAALFFALHGSRPEAVAWAASRVDLFATFFVLLTLLSTNALLAAKRTLWYLPMVGCALAAVCCKESAFAIPFLVWAMLFLRNEPRRPVRVLAVLFVTTGVAFLFRYRVIGSVGGYGAAAGHPTVLHFSLVRTVNGLYYRQWALLFFPMNWSVPPSILIWFALAVFLALLIWLLVRARGDRKSLLAALGMTLAAALPVQHLLLISGDLNGARVLYLPALGLALFWGLLIGSRPSRAEQSWVMAGLLFFQIAALSHNLSIWRSVALEAQGACRFIATEIKRDQTPVAVPDLPFKRRGVYFLNNSFPACVMLNSGGELKTLPLIRTAVRTQDQPGVRVYRWDDIAGRMERSR